MQRVNGEPGVVVRAGAHVLAVIALGVHDRRIDRMHGSGNLGKLGHLQPSPPA